MFEQSSSRRRVVLPVCPWVGVYPPAAEHCSPQSRMWRTQRSRLLWKHQEWVTFEIQYCLHQRGSYLGSIKEKKNRAQIWYTCFRSVFTAGTFMSSFSRWVWANFSPLLKQTQSQQQMIWGMVPISEHKVKLWQKSLEPQTTSPSDWADGYGVTMVTLPLLLAGFLRFLMSPAEEILASQALNW